MVLGIVIGLIVIAVVLFIGWKYRVMAQMIIMLVAVFILVAIVGFFKYQGFQKFMAMKEGMSHMKQTVSTTTATLSDWNPKQEAVGSLRAAKGVDISNELAGIVETIEFNSGTDVKAGTLLVKLRAEDDIAKLQSLEASAKLAKITFERDRKQYKAQAISKATLDSDASNLTGAIALASQQRALVDKKFIRAPFSGHLGIRNVDLGQYLNPGTAIVTLQELDPIYLDFSMPQQVLAQVKEGQKITVKNDTYPGRTFTGKIAAISPKVDTTTRNVQIRAMLKNTDHALLPGMYATADIATGAAAQFVTLPQTAITYNPYGDTVFIVHDKNKEQDDKEAKSVDNPKDEKPKDAQEKSQENLVVDQVFVTTGETRGDQVQILKGVKEGDVIVSAGQLKLQNGSAITVNNAVTPKDDANPPPTDH